MKRKEFISLLLLGVGSTKLKNKTPKLTLPDHTSNSDMNIGVERMRIFSDGSYIFINTPGNVGMSDNNPNSKLQIKEK